MTDVLNFLRSLRVVRNFTSQPVSDEDVTAMLEVARWTGSSKNRQSWGFLVIRERSQLDALAECGSFTGPIRNAPLVIAPIGLPDAYEWDMGRVSHNLMLAAKALGLGSCPVTLHRNEEAKKVLGIPEDHGCRVVVAIGHPDMTAERAAREVNPLSGRRGMDELVRHERWV